MERRLRARAFRRTVGAAAAIGLLLRLGFAFGYWTGAPQNHDEREYLLLARNLAAGRGFTYNQPDGTPATGEHFGRPPLYPVFLAGILRAGAGLAAPSAPGDAAGAGTPGLGAIKVAQSLVGAATIWLIGLLALRAAGPKAGAGAAWLAAVYPSLVWTPAYVLSETLYSFLALSCVAVLDRAVTAGADGTGRVDRPWLGLGAGLAAGAAILTRPAMLFFLLLAVPWLAWRRAWRAGVLLVAGAAVVVAPWTARNASVYGRFVLVESNGGITFWTGNNPLARGEGDMAANPEIKRANLAIRAAHPGLTPDELEPVYYREAFAFVAANPVRWTGLLARKAFYTLAPVGPSYRLHSPRYYWASVVPYVVLLPLAVAGMLALWRRRRLPAPLLLLAASSVLICLVFFPQERFRIPVIDPTLTVGAAAWWALRSGSANSAPREMQA